MSETAADQLVSLTPHLRGHAAAHAESNFLSVHIRLFLSLLLGLCLLSPAIGAQDVVDPVFNFDRIYHDPLDVKLLKSSEEKGLVVEQLEYTAEVYQGKPVRIYAVLAYPKNGKNLPAIYWSQGGMYEASTFWPLTWAAKGYMCINVTLPHDIYNMLSPRLCGVAGRGCLIARLSDLYN